MLDFNEGSLKLESTRFDMFCFISAIILSIMGIFSARYRRLAKEGVKCIFKKVSLRPCDASFDDKVKARILVWLAPRYPRAAKFIVNQLDFLAYFFFILFLVSFFFFFRGIYFYLRYGNCNGLSGGFCVLQRRRFFLF